MADKPNIDKLDLSETAESFRLMAIREQEQDAKLAEYLDKIETLAMENKLFRERIVYLLKENRKVNSILYLMKSIDKRTIGIEAAVETLMNRKR